MSEPKFKVGDIVKLNDGVGEVMAIIRGGDNVYYNIKHSTGKLFIHHESECHKTDNVFTDGADIKERYNEQVKNEVPDEEKRTQAYPADFIEFVCNKLDKVKELFRRKNQQYSVGTDPLANFRAGALLRAGNDSYAEMYEEAKNYRRKHVVHIERNGIAADKGDESLDDTIVYSAIMAYMRHCHEQEGCAK